MGLIDELKAIEPTPPWPKFRKRPECMPCRARMIEKMKRMAINPADPRGAGSSATGRCDGEERDPCTQ